MALRRQHALLFVAIALCVGCDRGHGHPHGPRFADPRNVANAMELYDSNQDLKLSGDELNQAPGLRAALPMLETDTDRGITAKLLAARLQQWDDSRIGRMALKCTITHNGKPLEGALVKFIPEEFLSEMLTDSASGTTDQAGVAAISLPTFRGPDEPPPGIPPGMYRVEITKDGENIPARYNTATELGQEISIDCPQPKDGPVTFDLRYD
jgi:hypothetical protein